jgi:hypothetical protein
LGCREQDLLLQADVSQQSRAELGIGGAIDRARRRHDPLEEAIETLVVIR